MKNTTKIIQSLQTLVILGMLAFFTISMVASNDNTNENNTVIAGEAVWDYNGLAEIKMFAGNFAPRGWAFCDGQLLPISQNTALFSLIGTTYGGDGRTTFGLPDLRGRVPVHIGGGAGPGLTTRQLGQKFGSETNSLTQAQLPAHNHIAKIEGNAYVKGGTDADTEDPIDNMPGFTSGNTYNGTYSGRMASIDTDDLSVKTEIAGTGAAVNNMQPSLGVHYIICLQGTYPSRN